MGRPHTGHWFSRSDNWPGQVGSYKTRDGNGACVGVRSGNVGTTITSSAATSTFTAFGHISGITRFVGPWMKKIRPEGSPASNHRGDPVGRPGIDARRRGRAPGSPLQHPD